MIPRFLVLFVGLAVIQWLALISVPGFQRIYVPFFYLLEPILKEHYGGNDGNIGKAIFHTLLLGVSVYSIILASAGAFLWGRTFSKSSPDV
jgi:hypothetical protein